MCIGTTQMTKFFYTAHGDLLEVTTSVFLSCALSHLPSSGKSSAGSPIAQAKQLLGHVVKLLSVFVHVIEEREPEIKEKVSVLMYMLQQSTCIYMYMYSTCIHIIMYSISLTSVCMYFLFYHMMCLEDHGRYMYNVHTVMCKLIFIFSTVHLIILCSPQKHTKPILSPKKPIISDSPSPSKPKSQPLDLFQKPPLAPRYLSQ